MFWGITLDTGKKYTQIVEKSFHLSMAALGFQNPLDTPVTIMVEVNKAQFALCTLQAGRIPQQPLDLNFTEGEEVTFYTEGKGEVHLTGFLQDEPETVEFEDIDENLTSSEGSESEEESDNEADSDEDSLDDAISLHELLEDAVENAEEDDDSDFDPSRENPEGKRKRKVKKLPQNEKVKDGSKLNKEPDDGDEKAKESHSSISLLDMEFDEEDDDNDDAWQPTKKVDKIKISKPKHKVKAEKVEETVNGEVDDATKTEECVQVEVKTEEINAEESAKKKRKKKRKLKHAENGDETNTTQEEKKIKRTENGVELEPSSDMTSPNTNNNKPVEDKNITAKSTEQSSSSETTLDDSAGKSQTNNEKITNGSDKQQNSFNTSPQKEKSKPQKLEKKTITGGTVIEDLKLGEGKLAQKGKRVFVYYRGILAKNQKEFDSQLKGKPFSFLLGRGEVIKGWDNGVEGMKMGGKRRITVPPSQGYGTKGTGPIPPNSSLVFEVQLIKVS